MSGLGSRNNSGHSRHSSSNRSNRSRNTDSPPPTEQGVEVIPKSRYLSTSHAGVMRRKEGSSENAELTLSRHGQEDLEVVPEAAGYLERPSFNNGSQPGDLEAGNYSEEFGHYSEEFVQRMGGSSRMERMDTSMRTQDAQSRRMDLLERSERSDGMERRVDRSGHDSISRGPSSMSVVSDVSFGDKPYHSMPVISHFQDSGSILPYLNTSHKSTCSMTHGSKRMAEKRAAMLRSGNILYSEQTQEKKKQEDLELEFTRWGGRKNDSSRDMDRKRKLTHQILHKRKVKAEKRKSLQEQESFRTIDDDRPKHGFHDLWGFAFKQEQLEYDQLIKEDKDRELVASYCEEPFWKIIFHFKGTVLRVIIEDILFWLTLATYASIRIRFHMDAGEIENFDYQNLSQNLVYVGGFLLFFLVFYVNQNHHRYFELHKDTMVLMGRVNDVATLVKAVLPMERARRINRYMNAAHVAMYTGLSSTYEKENFFDPLEARFALLTDEELYRIVEEIDVDNSGPKAAFEIIAWIMCDIRDAQINSFIDTNEAYQLREQLLNFRSTIAKIFVTTTLPIPFFYVHFLSLLTAVFLPLFAVVVAYETGEVNQDTDTSVIGIVRQNGEGFVVDTDGSAVGGGSNSTWVAEIVSGLVVFLQALFVIGLRILGQQLSDPFGGDLIDLQIARYVNMILNGSNQILAAKRLHPPSIDTELRLQLKMSSLGQAFEYDTDEEIVPQD